MTAKFVGEMAHAMWINVRKFGLGLIVRSKTINRRPLLAHLALTAKRLIVSKQSKFSQIADVCPVLLMYGTARLGQRAGREKFLKKEQKIQSAAWIINYSISWTFTKFSWEIC